MPSPFTNKRGIITPFRRDQINDFANGGGKALLRSHLEQILGVRCASAGITQGEYPWRPEFGSLLDVLRHRNTNDASTQELARKFVVDAVARWTKLVRVTDVELYDLETDDGVTQGIVKVVKVYYQVVDAGIRLIDSLDLELPALAA